MSSVNDVSSSNNLSESMASQLKGSQLSQEDFLKLLLAQLKLQSPTSPFDSSTMMQQIAQLTSLSSAHELETTVRGLSENMSSSQVLEASRLVGKDVQLLSDKCPLIAGKGLQGAVLVPKNVESIVVTIKDENNKLIKTINLTANSDGVLDFNWNGMDQNNKVMAPGYYNISASSILNGENVALQTASNFKVNSVAVDKTGKGVILNVDGLGGAFMKDIIKIM